MASSVSSAAAVRFRSRMLTPPARSTAGPAVSHACSRSSTVPMAVNACPAPAESTERGLYWAALSTGGGSGSGIR
ncbi:hypothetical protein [Streptomyces fradiae]|uniref:hypothetical protein n=1 Tax=Streptomyces fradiae TaxID=1906 RepID=UPI0018E2CB82